jgi:NADH-quinone oxidoreductase subunit A
LGWLLRPRPSNPEKDAVYECGEPTIGGSLVQFDLRFYVVALLFIIFDVEVAFFFPWAVVFGKANTLANERLLDEQRQEISATLVGDEQLRTQTPEVARKSESWVDTDAARKFMKIALVDLVFFFGVVLVGFAYVWRRGDLDWVRSVARQRALERSITITPAEREPAMAG